MADIHMPSTSSGVVGANVRLRQKIYLIGYMSHQITGCKLPSNRQVLSSLFFNMREVKLDKRQSAKLTITEVLIFWDKARIPVRHLKDCITKLEKLYDEWRNLQKHSKRTSKTHKNKEHIFESTLDDLFDIAHQNALETMKIDEDKQFLTMQRQKGRPGAMAGVDQNSIKAEERRAKRRAAEMKRRQEFNEAQRRDSGR